MDNPPLSESVISTAAPVAPLNPSTAALSRACSVTLISDLPESSSMVRTYASTCAAPVPTSAHVSCADSASLACDAMALSAPATSSSTDAEAPEAPSANASYADDASFTAEVRPAVACRTVSSWSAHDLNCMARSATRPTASANGTALSAVPSTRVAFAAMDVLPDASAAAAPRSSVPVATAETICAVPPATDEASDSPWRKTPRCCAPLPTPTTRSPTFCVTAPTAVDTGPKAAAPATSCRMSRCVPSSMSAKPCAALPTDSMSGVEASSTSKRAFTRGVPTSSATAVTRFCRIWKRAARESLRLSTSRCKAVFFVHSSLASATASVTSEEFPARRFITSIWRTEFTPRSCSIIDMLPPACVAPSRPESTAPSASTGAAFHFAANASALMPAALAHVDRFSELVATSLSMRLMMVDTAVPPASASTPMEESAAARPRMSAWLMPTCVPAAANLMAMAEMSLSVVAMLLPRPTMADA